MCGVVVDWLSWAWHCYDLGLGCGLDILAYFQPLFTLWPPTLRKSDNCCEIRKLRFFFEDSGVNQLEKFSLKKTKPILNSLTGHWFNLYFNIIWIESRSDNSNNNSNNNKNSYNNNSSNINSSFESKQSGKSQMTHLQRSGKKKSTWNQSNKTYNILFVTLQ